MAKSHISELVKLRHSDSGKLNVVRGAISERIISSEGFVRKSQTLKSYGTLVTLPYHEGSEGELLFPDAKRLGAVPFEKAADGYRLTVVDWAIPKVSVDMNLTDPLLMDIEIIGYNIGGWPNLWSGQRWTKASYLAVFRKEYRLRRHYCCVGRGTPSSTA